MRTPEFRISFAMVRRLHSQHGINLLASVQVEKFTDPAYFHTILSCVLGEEEAEKYEETHTVEQIARDIFQPMKPLRGEPEYEETGGVVTETEAPKSGG